jgi:hypothetical protein
MRCRSRGGSSEGQLDLAGELLTPPQPAAPARSSSVLDGGFSKVAKGGRTNTTALLASPIPARVPGARGARIRFETGKRKRRFESRPTEYPETAYCMPVEHWRSGISTAGSCARLDGRQFLFFASFAGRRAHKIDEDREIDRRLQFRLPVPPPALPLRTPHTPDL